MAEPAAVTAAESRPPGEGSDLVLPRACLAALPSGVVAAGDRTARSPNAVERSTFTLGRLERIGEIGALGEMDGVAGAVRDKRFRYGGREGGRAEAGSESGGLAAGEEAADSLSGAAPDNVGVTVSARSREVVAVREPPSSPLKSPSIESMTPVPLCRSESLRLSGVMLPVDGPPVPL